MGIQDLWTIVKEAQEDHPLKNLGSLVGCKIPKVAIDTMLLVFKHYAVSHSNEVKAGCFDLDNIEEKTIRSIMSVDKRFKENSISTVWCFDGDKSNTKLATKKRKDAREEQIQKANRLYQEIVFIEKKVQMNSVVNPYKKLFEDNPVIEFVLYEGEEKPDQKYIYSTELTLESVLEKKRAMVEILKNQFIIRPAFFRRLRDQFDKNSIVNISVKEISEGEKLASIMSSLGFVHAVYSCDSDLIPLETRYIIKEIKGTTMTFATYEGIKKCLDLDDDQIKNLCILLGCDFNERIRGFGAVTSLKHVRKDNFDIFAFAKEKGMDKVCPNECFEYFDIIDEEKDLVLKCLEKAKLI